MCGFIGLISADPANHSLFSKAAKTISERGNRLALRHDGREKYGYSRLPTDDTTNEQLNDIESDTTFLLFNGLITNSHELTNRYSLSPQARDSDQYCLREGLARHGTNFLAYCRGMFAFAFITEEAVILVRDTIGIKPLYYAHADGTFIFASEAKALQCFNINIHEVRPGAIVRFIKVTGEVSVSQFAYKDSHDESSSLETLLYESAVLPTIRYLDRTPHRSMAVLLSGGVDSSILAQLLVNHLSGRQIKRIIAFSVGEDSSSDVVTAKRLATRLKLHHVHVLLPSDEAMLNRLEHAVYRVESPDARVAKVALLYNELAVAIKQRGIDIVIGGEGADELFFGYHRFIDGLTANQSQEVFDDFYKEVFPCTLLQRYDRIFAGQRIEGRVPFLDQAVVAHAHTIAPEHKVHYESGGYTSKLPLRILAKKIGLPRYIYDRKKEKMTTGATGKENTTQSAGYLEQTARTIYEASFQDIVSMFYTRYFPIKLHNTSSITEGTLMKKVIQLKQTNQIAQGTLYEKD